MMQPSSLCEQVSLPTKPQGMFRLNATTACCSEAPAEEPVLPCRFISSGLRLREALQLNNNDSPP
jgi:hypothetical protein